MTQVTHISSNSTGLAVVNMAFDGSITLSCTYTSLRDRLFAIDIARQGTSLDMRPNADTYCPPEDVGGEA